MKFTKTLAVVAMTAAMAVGSVLAAGKLWGFLRIRSSASTTSLRMRAVMTRQ